MAFFFACHRSVGTDISAGRRGHGPPYEFNELFVFLFSDIAVVEAAFGGAVAAAGEFEDVAGFLDVVGPVELEAEFWAGKS